MHSLTWIGEPLRGACRVEGRVRHLGPRVPLEFTPGPDDTATVRFAVPQRGLAPGQVLALHDGPRVLGGGLFGAS